MLRATVWMFRATVWMLRAIVFMLRATVWMLRGTVWMLRATRITLLSVCRADNDTRPWCVVIRTHQEGVTGGEVSVKCRRRVKPRNRDDQAKNTRGVFKVCCIVQYTRGTNVRNAGVTNVANTKGSQGRMRGGAYGRSRWC
eukprot:272294-Pyramimonas_sp.AAC.1